MDLPYGSVQAGGQPPSIVKQVFVGGVGPRFCEAMAQPAIVIPMLEMGNVGLYQHANGMAACTPAQRAAIWQIWPDAHTQGAGEVGGYTEADEPTQAFKQYLAFFGGIYPAETNMNIVTGVGDGSGTYRSAPGEALPDHVYTGYVTAADLATMESAIRVAKNNGARDVAIVLTPNGGGEDFATTFATGSFWTNVREGALYGARSRSMSHPTTFSLVVAPTRP